MFISFILILALTGCPSDTEDEGPGEDLVSGLTITGLKDYEGQYVTAMSLFDDSKTLYAYIDIDKDSKEVIGNEIVDGKVTLALSADLSKKYSGNDKDVDFLVFIQISNEYFKMSDEIYKTIAGKVNAGFKDGIGKGIFVPNTGLIVVVEDTDFFGKYGFVLSDNPNDRIMASGDEDVSDIHFEPNSSPPPDFDMEATGGLVKNGFVMLNVYTADELFTKIEKFSGKTTNMLFNIRFKDIPEFDENDLDTDFDGQFRVSFKNGIGVGIFE
ncbi:MAG: hypothetical protein FWH35_08930 [Treponema sp.]|nr:hypothetical protein [Treponema sp.]